MKKKLKLFVWDTFDPDYTSGLAFAIATTEQEAKNLFVQERGVEPLEWGGEPEVFSLSRKIARSVSGGN